MSSLWMRQQVMCAGGRGGAPFATPRPSDVGLPRGGLGGWAASHVSFAVHAAVLAINVAVERGDVGRTMEALLHPGAMLRGLRTALAAAYQDVLRGAQREKGGGREWVRTREGGMRVALGSCRAGPGEISGKWGGLVFFFPLSSLGWGLGRERRAQGGDCGTHRSRQKEGTSTPTA